MLARPAAAAIGPPLNEKPRGAGGRARGSNCRRIDLQPIARDDSPAARAAQRLARRFALSPPLARAVVALAGLGEMRA